MTAELMNTLEHLTADDLQAELERLDVRARLVRGLLAARRRIERERERFMQWDADEEARQVKRHSS